MDVALDPAALGVLGGDDALPGGSKLLQSGQELLGEADVSKHQSGLGGEVGDELVLGRGEGLSGTFGDGE